MTLLSDEALKRSKMFIYENGRLLDRKLHEYFFEGGDLQACLKALLAYQNPDGGFGNGIEPDLKCPDSTAIGAETAMVTLDMLGYQGPDIIDPLVDWLATNQHEDGYIIHPPKALEDYPFQPWWWNPDHNRVLSIVALLSKWGLSHDQLFSRARRFYESLEPPELDNFYSYPYFAYLHYCAQDETDKARLDQWAAQIPRLLDKHRDHYPLFGRHWFWARDLVSREILEAEAAAFAGAVDEDGGVQTAYPELPWWRPIWTLDGLIMLKKAGFLKSNGS
jgi:hypothetical protein